MAASVSVNVLTSDNTAKITHGANITAHGALKLSAQAEDDAGAKAVGASLAMNNSTNVGAAVGLNVVNATNKAQVTGASTVSGNGITIEAIIPTGKTDDFIVWGAAAAATGDNGTASVAGSVGINVIHEFETEASTAAASHLESSANTDVTAKANFDLQTVAAAAAFSEGGSGFGATINVAVMHDVTTKAFIAGDADEAGALTVDAESTLNPTPIAIPHAPSGADLTLTSVAVAGSASGGDAAVSGSFIVNVLDIDVDAHIGSSSHINKGGLYSPSAGQTITVKAINETEIRSVAGALGITTGSTGIGIGLDVEILTKHTFAYIGSQAMVQAGGAVSVTATSTETMLSVAGTLGVGDDVGVTASVAIADIHGDTEAYIDGGAHVDAGAGVTVDASSSFTTTMIAGSVGAGGDAGIGVANTTLVHSDTVLAYVGQSAKVNAGGDVDITASAGEDIITIAAGIAVGGDAGVAGSAAINVLDETTKAYVGPGATVTTSVGSGGNLQISASDPTSIVSVAGSLGISGGVAAGVGADVGDMTKHTYAYIDSGVTATIDGNITVDAESSESLISVAAGIGVGDVGVAADAGVHVFDLHTRAFIGDDPANPSGFGAGDVHATGSISVAANDASDINEVVGVLAAGSVGVAAGVGVDVFTKDTEAFIGAGANVTADGFGTGLSVNTGRFDPQFDTNASTFDPQGGSAGVKSGDASTFNDATSNNPSDRAQLKSQGQVNTPQLGDMDLNNNNSKTQMKTEDPSLSGRRSAPVHLAPGFHGLAVAATNTDAIRTFTISFAAGSVGVGVSAGVDVVHATTKAYIGDNATINTDTPAPVVGPRAQSVLVGAGDDFYHLAIGVGVGVGGVGVAPNVGVNIVGDPASNPSPSSTEAFIGKSAIVNALNDVVVEATAAEDTVLVGIAIGGGGVGVGANVGVMVINDITKAFINDGAHVTANGDVLVSAVDDSQVFILSGALGVGGSAGIGAAVGVMVFDKDTQAFIGNDAHVDAFGGDGRGGVLTGGITSGSFDKATESGVIVQAESSENVLHIVAAGGGGFVGVSGAVGITLMNTDTDAIIGQNAVINGDQADAHLGQNVYVNAADAVSVQTYVIGIAAGFAGISGAIDVGTLNANVRADVEPGADVHARGDIHVDALSLKNFTGFDASGAFGAVGVGGTVSVWSIGTQIEKTTTDNTGTQTKSALDGGGSSADTYATGQVDGGTGLATGSSGKGGGFGNFSSDATGNPNTNTNRVHAGTQKAMADLGSSVPTGSAIAGEEDAAPQPKNQNPAAVPLGTTAVVEGGANLTAGGAIGITANEVDSFTVNAGQIAAGIVGAGASVALLSVADNVAAFANGNLSAGGNIDVNAFLNEGLNLTAIDGSAGFVGIGAAVVVINDNSLTQASLGNVTQAGDVTVNASDTRNIQQLTGEVAAGGVAAGVSFTNLNITGGANAIVANNAQIGQSAGKTVHSLKLTSSSTDTAETKTVAVSAGIGAFSVNFAEDTMSPSVDAEIGDGANIKTTGDVTIDAAAVEKLDTNIVGVAAGGLAVGASIAEADVEPHVTASIGNGTTAANNISVTASTNQGVDPHGGFGANADGASSAGAVVAVAGASTTAIMSPVIESAIKGRVNASGSVQVRAIGNNRAAATSHGIGGGLVGVGASISEAKTQGSTTAHLDGEVRNDTGGPGAVNLTIEALDTDTASAYSQAVGGGLIAGTDNKATVTMTPTVHGYISTSGLISTTGNINVTATENPEGDAVTKGVTGGLIGVGASSGDTTINPDVLAYISAGTVHAGTLGTNQINVKATAAPPSVNVPTYTITSINSANDTLHVAGNGLTTGDVVTYDNEGHTLIGATATGTGTGSLETSYTDPTTIDNNTGKPSIVIRSYNVISIGVDDLALGSIFDGAAVNADTDTITFQTPHNFQSGDAVVYEPGAGSPVIGGLTAGTTYYVRVLDGFRIKLETTQDRALNPQNYLTTFDPTLITGGNTINVANNFTNQEAVTYEAPPAETFSSKQVDNATSTIKFLNDNGSPQNPFSNGQVVTYDNSSSITTGVIFDNSTTLNVTFNQSATLAVTFGNNGTHDTITRTDGKNWVDFGFIPGEQITITGAGNNNGTFTIADNGVTNSTLQLTSNGSFAHTVIASFTFSNNGTNDTIRRNDGGNWQTGGYQPGQVITVAGSGNDDGAYTIAAGGVGTSTLTLTSNGSFAHANTAQLSLGNSGTHDTITRADGANWLNLGYAAGQQIHLGGAGLNNGTYTIDAGYTGGATLLLTTNGAFAQTDAVSVTFGNNGTNDTIKRADGLDWSTLGYAVGQQIVISGNGDNNGTYTIDAGFAGGDTLVLTSNLPVVVEGPETKIFAKPDTVSITSETFASPVAAPLVAKSISVISQPAETKTIGLGLATITRTDGSSWLDAGFAAGQQIHISGAGSNDNTYTIADHGVTASTIVLTASAGSVTAEGPEAKTINIVKDSKGNPVPDTITRTDGGSWLSAGYKPGQQITVSGLGNNNGTYTIAANGVSASTLVLTVSGSLIPEGPDVKTISSQGDAIGGLSAGKDYVVANVNTGAGTLQLLSTEVVAVNFTRHDAQNDNGNDTIDRTDGGSWINDGFFAGETISVTDTSGNNRNFTIAAGGVGTTSLTLTVKDTVTVEHDTAARIDNATPITLSNLTGASVTHTLVKAGDLPIGGLNSGQTYYVINPGNSTTSFQLALTPGGSAIGLTVSPGASANHKIGPEGIDLSASSGLQELRIDITGGPGVDGQQQLLGPGGVPLNVVSPPSGDGISSAVGNGSGGGFVGINTNHGTLTENPTVTAYVSAGIATVGGDISIIGSSTTNSTASAKNDTGGFVGVGDSKSENDQAPTTIAYVDTGTHIVAGGNFTLTANSLSQATAATRSITGGFVGVANATANSTIDYTTSATVKANADVLAGNTINVAADTKIGDPNTGSGQSTNAYASGIGLGGDGHANANNTIGHVNPDNSISPSHTTVDVANAASLSARAVRVAATVSRVNSVAHSEGYGAGFVAIGSGNSNINAVMANKVSLDTAAAVTGYEGVDFIANYDHIYTEANAFGRATGLFGDVHGDSVNNTRFDSQIFGAKGSQPGVTGAIVTAGPRDPSDPLLPGDGGYTDHLAFRVTTANGTDIKITAPHDSSKRSLATGGDSAHGGPGDNGDRPSIDNDLIDFSSDVVILSGRSPELTVTDNGAGGVTVTRDVNVPVTIDDADKKIIVGNIVNKDPGQVFFSTGKDTTGALAGSIKDSAGTGLWTFVDTFDHVRLLNLSQYTLQVGGISVVNTTVEPVVDIQNTSSLGLSFNIKRTVKPTLVDVESLSAAAPAIVLDGQIENPIGTTRIISLHGDIRSTASRTDADNDPSHPNTTDHLGQLIRTNILDLETPDGNIGQNPGDLFGQTPVAANHRINVDMVDSANVPAATDFLSARVSSADGSIYLGLNQFFTGELVQYNTVGGAKALNGLTSGDYYYVIASDLQHIQLARINDPHTALKISAAGPLTDTQSLTPAQRFTVVAGNAANGNALDDSAYLDVKARFRDNNTSVIIDAVNTTGDANLKLWGSVKETDVSGVDVGNGGGKIDGIDVVYAGHIPPPLSNAEDHFTFFNTPDTTDGGSLDVGMFALAKANATHIDSIYVVKALTQDGHLYRPGISSGHNIIVTAAEPTAGQPEADLCRSDHRPDRRALRSGAGTGRRRPASHRHPDQRLDHRGRKDRRPPRRPHPVHRQGCVAAGSRSAAADRQLRDPEVAGTDHRRGQRRARRRCRCRRRQHHADRRRQRDHRRSRSGQVGPGRHRHDRQFPRDQRQRIARCAARRADRL
ncbi:hypothetical protein [Bradyrhizobium sp. JR3.5]